jgi:L-iditol 2-dehydrogenase
VPDPEPGAGEVLLRVGACGVCGSDIPRIFSKGTYSFPLIPGHELAGVVARAGVGVDSSLLGKAVAVFPLIPCHHCAMCEIGEYAVCSNYNYLGSRCDGGFAEYVRVPAWNLLPVPKGVSIEEAALCEPAAVALHGLRRGDLHAGDRVLIVGAGTIGLLLAMWARSLDAGKVLLVDIDRRRLDFAKSLGFEDVADPASQNIVDWVRDRASPGADVTVEAAGNGAALEQCLANARPLGRVVLLGNPSGEMTLTQAGYWSILRKQLVLRGTWNSTFRAAGCPSDWSDVLDQMARGKLDVKPLITHRAGLESLPDVMKTMSERTQLTNKVLFVNDER